jgi:hypothetical protein
MKSKLLLVMLMTLLITPLSFAKNSERLHYKCYVQLSDQSDVVHRFVSAEKSQSEFEEGLPGSIVYSSDGVTGLKIITVYQCVGAKQSFKNKQAITIEAKTPF